MYFVVGVKNIYIRFIISFRKLKFYYCIDYKFFMCLCVFENV